MKKISKSSYKSASHRLFKDKANNRFYDLQLTFMDLQFARKESLTVDVAVLEEQVHQMLREWKAELNEPSPASSLQQGGILGSFSTDICRLLQLCEEEDDASSPLVAPKLEPNDKALEAGDKVIQAGDKVIFQATVSLSYGRGNVSFGSQSRPVCLTITRAI